MPIVCPFCKVSSYVKSGFIRGKQRYKCKGCLCNFVQKDSRIKYENKTRNLVIRMYLNNCGFRRISEILSIPLATCFVWIKNAGKIVDEMVKERKGGGEDIGILEMDELYTYIKKSLVERKRMEDTAPHIPEYGLLWIGTDLKLLRLK